MYEPCPKTEMVKVYEYDVYFTTDIKVAAGVIFDKITVKATNAIDAEEAARLILVEKLHEGEDCVDEVDADGTAWGNMQAIKDSAFFGILEAETQREDTTDETEEHIVKYEDHPDQGKLKLK